jgi:hypothetical protein
MRSKVAFNQMLVEEVERKKRGKKPKAIKEKEK